MVEFRYLWRGALLGIAIASLARGADAEAPNPSPSVGMTARIEQIVLPGSELEPKPNVSDNDPISLRISFVSPHGSAYRYDLEFQGFEPGKYDLKNYLKRKDATSIADLPSIPVEIRPLLPPGQILPNTLGETPSPWVGGYQLIVIATTLAWTVGLGLILLLGGKKKADRDAEAKRPATLADRLRPLVEAARGGTLSLSQRAELERTLIAHWLRRLQLDHAHPAESLATLRRHHEAGPLLERLEAWLHRPDAKEEETASLAELLEPYRDIPAEAWDQAQAQASMTTPPLPRAMAKVS